MSEPTTVVGKVLSHFPRFEFEKSIQDLGGDHHSRLYHCGMKLKQTTLCDALVKRDSGVFESAFNSLAAKAMVLSGDLRIRFRNTMKLH